MPPILVAELFPEITAELLALLRSLSPAEWHAPTVSSRRVVKDVVGHLLDGSLRRLSRQRDGYVSPDPRTKPAPDEPLVAFLGRLNDEWETAARRLSPEVLIALVAWADAELASLFRSLDPHAEALFPVAWAGEDRSENWMDVAREYTEKWHHTQQIFDAVGRPGAILDARLGRPAFDVFLRALPFAYRDVSAEPGTVVAVTITGAAGGTWRVERGASGWTQIEHAPRPASATVTIDQADAWKLLTKRRGRDENRRRFPAIQIEGDEALGLPVLDMVSVMA